MPEKILIVDDSPTIVEMVKTILESSGYEVVTATDGMEALNKARSEQPDLIILDIVLPKIQGYQVCRLLKFDDNYRNIPIVMCSSQGKEEQVITGKRTGADEYLVKPVAPEKLLETIKAHLKAKKEEKVR